MNDLAKKLKLKEGVKIALFNPPNGFQKKLNDLPKGCKVVEPAKRNDFIMLFVENKAELEKEIFKISKTLNKEGFIWIAYPKISSGIQTDLTRDKGWDCLKKLDMKWTSLISLDDTWSAFCLKNVPNDDNVSKTSTEYHNNVSEWIDTVNKKVKIPGDLGKAMNTAKTQNFFEELSFTNRKEYVMWIISAKQEKTREERVKKAIDKMKSGKKNPSEK